MSDTDGSLFEEFTEAGVHLIPPTQAVMSVVVVSPIRSIGSEPPMRTASILSHTGYRVFSSQHSGPLEAF